MALARKHQILMKLETAEGVDANPGAPDAVTLAERPSVSPNVALEERESTGASLSRNFSTPGRADIQFTLPLDLIGSRDPKVLPDETTVPPIDTALRMSGFTRTALAKYYTATVSHVGSFAPGDALSWSGGTGVAANYSRPRSGGVGLLIYDLSTGAAATNGQVINNNTVPGVAATSSGGSISRRVWQYRPTSERTVVITLSHVDFAGWSPAVGDTLVRTQNTVGTVYQGWYAMAGTIVAAAVSGGFRIVTVDVSTVEAFVADARVTYINSAGVLWNVGGDAATVAEIAVGSSPSATIKSKLDGYGRSGVGCRGNVGMSGQAGQTGRLNLTATGSMLRPGPGQIVPGGAQVDLANIPRWELAAATWDGTPIPAASFELNMGQTITPLPDVHGPNGVRFARIVDRNPQLSMDPDLQDPLFRDFTANLLDAASVNFRAQLGWQAANTFLIHIPAGQVTSVTDGERDGIATANVQMNARRAPGQDDQEVTILAF